MFRYDMRLKAAWSDGAVLICPNICRKLGRRLSSHSRQCQQMAGRSGAGSATWLKLAAGWLMLIRHRRLFDHLVGTLPKKQRHVEAERPRGLEVDQEMKLRRLLYRKLSRLRAS
jgi:hypothetical protein